MATMNISLPDPMKEFVEAQAASGGFGSVSEHLRSILREVQAREGRRALEAKLLEGSQGPSTVMTAEDWAAIEREAIEGLPGEAIRLRYLPIGSPFGACVVVYRPTAGGIEVARDLHGARDFGDSRSNRMSPFPPAPALSPASC